MHRNHKRPSPVPPAGVSAVFRSRRFLLGLCLLAAVSGGWRLYERELRHSGSFSAWWRFREYEAAARSEPRYLPASSSGASSPAAASASDSPAGSPAAP